jgi:translation initiation factor 4E
MWEDPANKAGGKWVMFIRGAQLLDSVWAFLAMALVGDMIDTEDKVCGLVVSARPKMDRIQVWTRTADDVEYLNGLAQRMLDTLGLGPGETENISLEFQVSRDNHDVYVVQLLTHQPHAAGVKADPKLMKIQPPAVAVSRSISLANIGNPNAPPHLRRSPSSPGTPFGPSPAHGAPTTNGGPHGSSHLSSPLNGSPMRRSGSAGATAFSGPMGAFSGGLGAARRLVSTTPNAAA